MSDLSEKQVTAIRLARKALLKLDDLDLDERWFVVGALDDAFPLIETEVPVLVPLPALTSTRAAVPPPW